MTYSPETSLIGPTLGTADDWIAWATENHASRLDDVKRYLLTVYEFGPVIGLAAHVIVCQSIHETSDPDTGEPWTSEAWNECVNPAGIGVTSDAMRTWWDFGDGRNAALAHLVRLCKYVYGPVPDILAPYAYLDPRGAVPASVSGKKQTLGSFGDADWKKNPTWAADDQYGAKWAGVLNRLESVFSTGAQTMARPRIILRSGHTDWTSGNAEEKARTDDMADAYLAEGKRRGYDIAWYNATLDGDGNTRGTEGDLTKVALGIGSILKEWGKDGSLSVFLDLHYDGYHAPLEAIPPGIEGWNGKTLVPAFSGGAPASDTTANNTLDVKLGAAWIQHVKKATGYGAYVGGWGVPGIMMERETGVGLTDRNKGFPGYRLGVFAGTAASQQTAVRLVLEHGGTYDEYANKFAEIAKAAFDAFDEVFEVTGDNPNPPVDPPAPITYASPVKPVFWDALMADGAVSAQDQDGNVWFRTAARYQVKDGGADQDQFAIDGAKDIDARLDGGDQVDAVAIGIAGKAGAGGGWIITSYLARIDLDQLTFVGPATV